MQVNNAAVQLGTILPGHNCRRVLEDGTHAYIVLDPIQTPGGPPPADSVNIIDMSNGKAWLFASSMEVIPGDAIATF